MFISVHLVDTYSVWSHVALFILFCFVAAWSWMSWLQNHKIILDPATVSGEDAYYTRLMQLEPGYRPYQHVWFKYTLTETTREFDDTVDNLMMYLRQFLLDITRSRTHVAMTGPDIVELDPLYLCSNDYVRGLDMPMIGVGIDRQARRVDILVNHRNIGGSALLDLIRYGVGGPKATAGTPIPPTTALMTLLSHVYFVGSLARHLVFKPANVVRHHFQRFGYQQEWAGTLETIHRVAEDVCVASNRKRLVCWCPVVFAGTPSTISNDVGVILFSYDRGMSTDTLRTRLKRARWMVHGARNASHVGGMFSQSMMFRAATYFKSRVDLVITMSRITGENRSTHGLTSFCGTFHSAMLNPCTYPYYAYVATLGETSHLTLTVTDFELQAPSHCCLLYTSDAADE